MGFSPLAFWERGDWFNLKFVGLVKYGLNPEFITFIQEKLSGSQKQKTVSFKCPNTIECVTSEYNLSSLEIFLNTLTSI